MNIISHNKSSETRNTVYKLNNKIVLIQIIFDAFKKYEFLYSIKKGFNFIKVIYDPRKKIRLSNTVTSMKSNRTKSIRDRILTPKSKL